MFGVVVTIVLLVGELTVRIGLILTVLLRRRTDPTLRLAWLCVLVLMPVVGAIAYLLVGEPRLGRRRISRHREVVLLHSRAAATAPPDGARAAFEAIPPHFRQIAALAEAVGGSVPMNGNALRLLGDPVATIDAIVTDIDAATREVHLLTYIFLDDATGRRIAESLMRAEHRGVQCRVLADDVGSARFLRSGLCARMRDAGVQVHAALPVNALRALFARADLRNHRKVAVIDGRIGYTGSRNIADASFAPKRRFAPWVDAMVRIEGPVTHDLQLLFVEDWYLDTDEWLESAIRPWPAPVPGGAIAQHIGTGPNAYNQAMRQLLLAAMHLAREELVLTTPYFVPDEAVLTALMTAATQGVQTDLVVPARNDSRLVAAASRSYYDPLIEAGVNIHEYRAGLLHAKTLTVDRDLAVVSSANIDRRSFFLNFEASLIVYDSDFASHLRLLQKSYLNDSRPIDSAVWRRRRWPLRLIDNTAGMLSPLL